MQTRKINASASHMTEKRKLNESCNGRVNIDPYNQGELAFLDRSFFYRYVQIMLGYRNVTFCRMSGESNQDFEREIPGHEWENDKLKLVLMAPNCDQLRWTISSRFYTLCDYELLEKLGLPNWC